MQNSVQRSGPQSSLILFNANNISVQSKGVIKHNLTTFIDTPSLTGGMILERRTNCFKITNKFKNGSKTRYRFIREV